MKEFRATTDDIGVRVDVFVSAKYPEFTRSSLERLFDKNMVAINGSTVKPSYRIKKGEKVIVDDELIHSQPEKINLPVIFEDNNVLVIDKPSGVLTHSKGALNEEATVADFVKDKLNHKSLDGNRAGIVHRLDRPTSGVIITAKTADSVKYLQKQFSQRKTKKIYIAIVEGSVEPKEAVIEAPIMRNSQRPQTFGVNKAGKQATTQYKVIKDFNKAGKNYSLVELLPKTGRTHQLRVHMVYIGHPIVGDSLYGAGLGEMMLHAASLEITLPDGQRKVFKSKSPSRIEEFIG